MSQQPVKFEVIKSQATKIEGGAANVRIEDKMNYDQGTEASKIQFSLICHNIPKGSVVGFRSNTPGPNPPIELPPTTVVTSPTFIIGMVCYVPADYKCVITYYADVKDVPPPDAQITLQAAYPMNS